MAHIAMSGFASIVATATAMATLEGDNYVMYQQTARFLMKSLSGECKPALDESVVYLGSPATSIAVDADILNSHVHLGIFQHRAARLVAQYYYALNMSQTRDGLSPVQAWNTHMMGLISFSLVDSGPTRTVLERLCSLFALSCIDSPHGAGFLEHGSVTTAHRLPAALIGVRGINRHTGLGPNTYATKVVVPPAHLPRIRAAINALLNTLLLDAVALTDAWNFSDASLESALGCWDGDVYERMMRWTRQVPLNVRAEKTDSVFRPGWEEYIRPILKGKL
ncbi:acyl-CoA oxidase-domain-containing protein [Mycena crocata]|nr:acyl-CoA oxidase-domain-containing protein [Mycena crocata]